MWSQRVYMLFRFGSSYSVCMATHLPFIGKQWCFSFQYRMNGDDTGTINLYLVKNKQMNAGSKVFTVSEDRMSFYITKNIDIDGRQYADSDMVEVRW